MEKYAELRTATTAAKDQAGNTPVVVSTTPAVPLLWLSLFSYDECQIRRDGTLEVFFASTGLADAQQRARGICKVIPTDLPLILEAAHKLSRALRSCDGEQLELFPVKLFSELLRDQ